MNDNTYAGVPDAGFLSSMFKLSATRYFAASDLYSSLALQIAEDVELLEIAWPAKPGQALPFLLFAAVHSLVLENPSIELAQFFPTVTPEPAQKADPYPVFKAFVLGAQAQIFNLIKSAHVNKTVIKRSACLRALLVKVASDNGWDKIHLVDIGCSAGFNLLMDYWRINYQGAGAVGPLASPVHFTVELRGNGQPPLGDCPQLISRTGIDLDSFDLSSAKDVRWLLGCLVPEALETFNATKQAFSVLHQNRPRLITGDATRELANVLQGLSGNEPVIVMHSLMLQHLSLHQKRVIHETIKQASAARPVARVGMELSGEHSMLSIASDSSLAPTFVGEADDDANWIRWY